VGSIYLVDYGRPPLYILNEDCVLHQRPRWPPTYVLDVAFKWVAILDSSGRLARQRDILMVLRLI
jgi:hypothetical protein